MAGSESSKSLTLWPKLLLWGAAIVVGFLYLGSLDRHPSKDQEPGAVGEAAERVPLAAEPEAPASEKPSEQLTRPEVEIGGEMSAAGPAQPVEDQDRADKVEHAAEPAAEAARTPARESEIPRAAETMEQTAPAALQSSAAVVSSPPEGGGAEAAGAAGITTSTADVKETPGKVSPEEAKAFAEAVISEGDVRKDADATGPSSMPEAPALGQPLAPMPAVAAPPASPQATTPPPTGPALGGTSSPAPSVPEVTAPAVSSAPMAVMPPVPMQSRETVGVPMSVPETMEQRRARVMSEYEEMRKRAEEAMRKRWEQGGIPVPYGYPGYAPGYMPQRPQ